MRSGDAVLCCMWSGVVCISARAETREPCETAEQIRILIILVWAQEGAHWRYLANRNAAVAMRSVAAITVAICCSYRQGRIHGICRVRATTSWQLPSYIREYHFNVSFSIPVSYCSTKTMLDFIQLGLDIKHKIKIYISSTHEKQTTIHSGRQTKPLTLFNKFMINSVATI